MTEVRPSSKPANNPVEEVPSGFRIQRRGIYWQSLVRRGNGPWIVLEEWSDLENFEPTYLPVETGDPDTVEVHRVV